MIEIKKDLINEPKFSSSLQWLFNQSIPAKFGLQLLTLRNQIVSKMQEDNETFVIDGIDFACIAELAMPQVALEELLKVVKKQNGG